MSSLHRKLCAPLIDDDYDKSAVPYSQVLSYPNAMFDNINPCLRINMDIVESFRLFERITTIELALAIRDLVAMQR